MAARSPLHLTSYVGSWVPYRTPNSAQLLD